MPFRLRWEADARPATPGYIASILIGGVASGHTAEEIGRDAGKQADVICSARGLIAPEVIRFVGLHNWRADWEPIYGEAPPHLHFLDDEPAGCVVTTTTRAISIASAARSTQSHD